MCSSKPLDELHMVQLWMDTKRMAELSKALSLPPHTDLNYLVHCALGKLFQEHAPKPFAVEDHPGRRGRFVRVLGYAGLPADGLHEMAKAFAEPMAYEICDFERMAAKPMPDRFPDGVRLGFEARVCPVLRKASDSEKWRKGDEVDVFLDKAWAVGDEVELDRKEIYEAWFSERIAAHGGARILDAKVTRFSLEKMVRRTSGKMRKAKTFTRPAATLSGRLEVQDGMRFQDLLGRGIGRHKSFGFGMVKVRRLRS